MLTNDDMKRILGAVAYKKGTRLLFKIDPTRNNAPYIQWEFEIPCVKTERDGFTYGRKWYLSQHMSESELVLTVFKAALTTEEHECREHFVYMGKRIFNPHVSVRALMTICDEEEVRE